MPVSFLLAVSPGVHLFYQQKRIISSYRKDDFNNVKNFELQKIKNEIKRIYITFSPSYSDCIISLKSLIRSLTLLISDFYHSWCKVSMLYIRRRNL